jgi:hypothetical protein
VPQNGSPRNGWRETGVHTISNNVSPGGASLGEGQLSGSGVPTGLLARPCYLLFVCVYNDMKTNHYFFTEG